MEPCPPGREITEFQFKQFCSVRVFPAIDFQNFFTNPSNTITASNKHGLLIVGTPTGFQIVNLAQLVAANASEFVNETIDYPRREYNINAQPCHISLNCDETLLSVAHQSTDNAPLVRIYKMASLTNQSKNKVVKIPIGPPGTCITDFSWNPVIPELLSMVVSNGCLCLYSHDDTGKKLDMLPPEKQVTSVSWSPKGKQLLAGDKYGNIVQYKPDLKDPQKIVHPPKELFPNQCSIVNVIWLSVYQYGVIYLNTQSMETHFSIVNAPKNGPVRYVSYDEICFNSGTVRPHQFYLMHLPAWNILIISSSNSTEVSVLSLLDDKVSWEQWLQEDSTRLDLPIDKNKSETYPVGVTIAMCSQLKIKWGENNFLPPMPTLSIVSNDGLVLLFHVINTTHNAPQLCSPPTPLPDHMFGTPANPLVSTPGSTATAAVASMPVRSPQVSVVSAIPPNFNISNVTATQGQSPVLEISTNQNSNNSGAPLALFNKPQISLTPVAPQAKNLPATSSPLSIFALSGQPAVSQTESTPPKPDSQFQAMTESIFQTVLQSNTGQTQEIDPPPIQPEPSPTPVAPTIVKTNLQKQQLIVEPTPEVNKSSPKERTGTIKKEDLEIFLNLEENINHLLKSYKMNIGSTELDGNLTKINDRVDQLENFFSQLEDSTKSLANDITSMKHALNEAIIYAHESKDQLAKYERKKGHEKDPMEGIMISRTSVNPIVEKKLLSIENEIRKSTYSVRSYIQDSRPILQHLELVKSGKNVLNFQSILQSINKEKAMISRCTLMLDEINRDVLKMFNKHHILRHPKSSPKELIVRDKKPDPVKRVDKFSAVKEQIKTKPQMSSEKLRKLKSLHDAQVLEPIRHSGLNMTNPGGLRMSDLLKVFKSPPKKPQITHQKYKVKPNPEQIVKEENADKGATFSLPTSVIPATPVVGKPKSSVPTALFGNENKPFVAPSPVICEKPEINKNTATFVIDTSNVKANATKLSFDDSIAAFSSNITKNMFTSTPAVSIAPKAPVFAAPTPGNLGTTFTKVTEVSTPLAPTKSTFKFPVPTSVPDFSDSKAAEPPVSQVQPPTLFSSGKPMFGGTITTGTSTTTAPVLSFGTSTSSPSSISSSITTKPETSVSFSVLKTTPVSALSTFSFMPSSTSKLSFGSTTFTVTTASATPFASVSSFGTTSSTTSLFASVPTFGTTSSSASTTAVSTPSFISPQAFAKATGITATSSNAFVSSQVSKTSTAPTFTFAPTETSKAISVSVSQAPDFSATPKFEFGMPTSFSKTEKKTPEREKSSDKKLEEISAGEHPLSAAPSDLSLNSLLSSSPNVAATPAKNVTAEERTPPSVKTSSPSLNISTADSKPVIATTAAPAAFSFGSSTASIFGGDPKMGTPTFSFLSAASESSSSSPSSSSTVIAKGANSSESIASTVSSVSSLSSASTFGTLKTTTSAFETPAASNLFSSAVTTVTSTEAVVSTPSRTPVQSSESAATEVTTVETSSDAKTEPITPPPSTPTSSAPPFSNSALVTPTSSTAAGFPSIPSSTASVFGSPTPAEPASSQADIGNLFGSSLSFGGATSSAPQANANVFGQSGGNIFASSSGGSFGQSSGSIFAQKPSTPSGNLFAQRGSVFGQQTPTTTGNVFAKSGSVFGDSSKPANAFGSPSPFGQQNATSTSSAFGASPSFGSGFGSSVKSESSPFFGQSTFGSTPTATSTSVFGAPTTSSEGVFGQPSSPFGFAQSNASSSFGSGNASGFGAKSTFGQSGGSIFGGKSTFGQSGGSIFGSGGSSSGGSVFGGGSSSGGFGSGGGAGFGQPATFGQPAQSAFGGSAFGGGSAGFGSSPTFGGSPAFGNTSPNKIFGSTDAPAAQAASPSFGMAAAGGNQLSFGNLAQQPQTGFGAFGQPQANSPPAFGSQPSQGFSNTPSGGGSFSSWR